MSDWSITVPAGAHRELLVHEEVPEHVQRVAITVQAGAHINMQDVLPSRERSYQLYAEQDAQLRYVGCPRVSTTYVLSAAQGAQVQVVCSVVATDQDITIKSEQLHGSTHGTSRFDLRVVVPEDVTVTHRGSICVQPNICSIVAQQHSSFLMLSERARAYAHPQLEIMSNDVHCTHGSAVGFVDEQQLQYCALRGFSLKQAQKLLVEAFVTSGIIDHTDVYTAVQKQLQSILGDKR